MNNTTIPKNMYFSVILSIVFLSAAISFAESPLKPVTSNGGGVRIEVTPLQLTEGKAMRLRVRLNTHSVSLYKDLAAVSILRDDKGREYKPVKWEGDPPGGHHRKGVLIFPELTAPADSVKLTIRGVAGVSERGFSWSLLP